MLKIKENDGSYSFAVFTSDWKKKLKSIYLKVFIILHSILPQRYYKYNPHKEY